jgi:hypothetical protein
VSALAVRERVRRELVRLAAVGTREGQGAVHPPRPDPLRARRPHRLPPRGR